MNYDNPEADALVRHFFTCTIYVPRMPYIMMHTYHSTLEYLLDYKFGPVVPELFAYLITYL